jgi:hypothetical protein
MLALVALAPGCKSKEDPPSPTAEMAGSAAVISPSARGKLPLRNPIAAPIPKIDPQDMKNYRVDLCYFGTLTLRQARDAYLASLGKDEPSEKKIPSFGAAAPPGPPPGMVPPGLLPAGSAAPRGSAAPAVASAAPGGSGAPAFPRPPLPVMRAPHERNARACTVAAGLKDAPMPEVDAALGNFATFALDLSKTIAEAGVYYQHEEYKKDEFKKGKEMHKKLVADFAKLDELSGKLGDAIAAWRKDHPADVTKLEEGEKLSVASYDDARGLVLGLLPKKIDTKAYGEAIGKIEKDIEALKTFGTQNTTDPWSKIIVPSLDAFVRTAKEAQPKITDKGVDPDAFLQIINAFTALIETKHRALSRALVMKGQTIEPRAIPRPDLPITPREAPQP